MRAYGVNGSPTAQLRYSVDELFGGPFDVLPVAVTLECDATRRSALSVLRRSAQLEPVTAELKAFAVIFCFYRGRRSGMFTSVRSVRFLDGLQ
jgi:hypothetical protein